jgi:phage/plasmid-associated DNA primase
MEQLTGRFNGHLVNMLLVHANEATWGGNKQAEGALKAIVTDSELPAEFKGKDIFKVRNYKRVIVSSNEEWAVPRGMDDRRFLVLEISPKHKEDTGYFGALHAEMDQGGLEALMYDLVHEDLNGFNLRRLPATKAGLDMKLKSADSVTRWLFDFLARGYTAETFRFAGHTDDYDIAGFSVVKAELFDHYLHYCRESEQRGRVEAHETFFRKLRKILTLGDTRKTKSDGGRERHAVFPALDEARKQFERYCKQEGHIDWDEPGP